MKCLPARALQHKLCGMKNSNSIATIAEEVAAYRRAMHENPGTAFEEVFASNLVAEKLTEWGIPFERGIAKTGIVATIMGKSPEGKTIGLRADMDALDIIEADNKPHKSKNPGKMHACGHDGHTAILLGTAKYLNETKNFNGKVRLIFQPAEEGAGGARMMIEEGLFERFPCDEVYGMHNWPGLPKGTMGIRPGPIMASTDKFFVTVKGRGGHAAMPHLAIDPIVISTQIINAYQALISRTVDPVDTAVISVTNMNGGTGAHNVIPDDAKFSGTVRTFNPKTREYLKAKMEEIAKALAGAYGASIEFQYRYVIDSTINDPKATALCVEVARSVVGHDNVNADVEPCMGGEDFGAMLEKVPGAYIWVGQAEPDESSNHNYNLHTPRYDFNDTIIPIAMEYYAGLVEKSMAA